MPKDEAGKLHAELKAHYETCQRKEPFTKIFGMKKMENGNFEFRAKRNGTNSQGVLNEKARVIDGSKQSLADLAIWGGWESLNNSRTPCSARTLRNTIEVHRRDSQVNKQSSQKDDLGPPGRLAYLRVAIHI
jgi:hypothetical protein